MALRAEIISIGDELTSGQRLDTNSQWISEQLGNVGVKTAFHTTVGDSMSDNVDAFRTASRRADIVIATGGLGPTADDLTREAIAEAFNAPLEFRQSAFDHIVALFAVRKRPMPERNRVQAMFPTGSRIIDNPHGSAPGIDFTVSGSQPDSPSGVSPACRIFALPGVPAEMKQMFVGTVEPRLTQEMGVGKQRWYFHTLKVFGIGESDVEKRLPDLIHRDRNPIVGITVSHATITLRIAALCSSEEQFKSEIQATIDDIRRELGLLVYGEGELDLHQAVHELMASRQCKLGVIEVGAGTWIQQSLASLSTSNEYGMIAAQWFPTIEKSMQGIPAESKANLIDPDDANDTVRALAVRAEAYRDENNLDLVLAAGIYPTIEAVLSSIGLPSSDFNLVIARRGKPTKHTSLSLGAHPDVLYHRLAKTGMNFLRLELLQDA